MRHRVGISFFLLLIPLIFCSCSGLQNASPGQARLASGPPHSGNARVFVYQPSRFLFTGAIHGVYIDGRLLGSNASGTFLVTELDPGHHAVTVGADQHELAAAAGRTYYYKQTTWMPMYNVSNATAIEEVPESVGRDDVRKCKQVASNF
jgi:hypothetical protein